MNKLIIVGASGHGKVVADIALLNGYDEIYFVDDNSNIKSLGNYEVIGSFGSIFDLAANEYDVFVGIGNASVRQRMQNQLEQRGYSVVTLIHPSAVVARDVQIGVGTVIMAGAVVNAGTVIGKGCIINTASSVDHDNKICDYVHVSVAAHTAGTVLVEDNTWIGIGAVISNNISISSDVMIGAGAVVVEDICESGTYVGVPAKKIR